MKYRFIILLYLMYANSFSQVGINTSIPDNSTQIDIFSTDKGLLLPRVSLISTTNTVTPINTPTTGLLVWNTNPLTVDGNGVGFYYYDGTMWVRTQRRGTLDMAYDQGGSGLGRTITADAGAVRIDGTDGLMITGAFGFGSLIDADVSGAGTRYFFNPRKAAFRAGRVTGSAFNDASMGNYSFAVGYNNIIDGTRTFGANFSNTTSTQNNSSIGSSNTTNNNNSFSSGFTTRAGGDNAFSTGSNTFSLGFHSFSNGLEARSSAINEFTIGHYPTIAPKTNSSGTLNVDSQSAFYTTDRAFAIGNGTSVTRKNALEIWKDGRVRVNSVYTFPTTDGTSMQRITTNGLGTLSWSTTTSATQISLYADDTAYTMSNISPATDLTAIESGIIPTLIQTSGNVRVKLVIRYSNLVGTPNFRLRVHDGTTQATPITTASGWTTTPNQVGGVIESTWRNWNGATGVYEAHLSGFMSNVGESITITNAYLMIAPQ